MNKAEYVKKSWSYEVKGIITTSKNKSPVVKPMLFAKIQTSKCWSKLTHSSRISHLFWNIFLKATILVLTFKTASEKLRKSEIEEHKQQINPVGQIEVRIHRDSDGKQTQVLPESEYEETDYSSMIHEKVLVKESKSHGTMSVFHFTIIPSKNWLTRWHGIDLGGRNH